MSKKYEHEYVSRFHLPPWPGGKVPTVDLDAEVFGEWVIGEPTRRTGSQAGSTEQAAAKAGISRHSLDRRLKALRGIGVDSSSLPGGPRQAGEGNTRRHWRWDLDRVCEFMSASERALSEREQKAKPKPQRGGSRHCRKSGRSYGPDDGRSLLARVTDGKPRGG